MLRVVLGAAASGFALVLSGCALFQTGTPLRPPAAELDACSGEVGARLRYLEPRLEASSRYTQGWWWWWMAVNGGGMVESGVQAGLDHDRGQGALDVTNAVQSAMGVADLVLDPPPLRRGVSKLQAIDVTAPAGCAARLQAAETLMKSSVADAHEKRFGWATHLGNLILNGVGAVIVAKGFGEPGGWSSGAIGFAVGELQLWSYPWQIERTREEYERRFGASSGVVSGWGVEERALVSH
jgi:hypothetical protein